MRSEAKTQILLVEPSSTMRHVVKNYAENAGHLVESLSNYGDAATALKSQFETFDSDIDCLLLGWPASKDRDSMRLLGMLEAVDYHDLPVIVLSQDMRPDSRAWVAGRDHSVMVRWKDYRAVDTLLQNLLSKELTDASADTTVKFSNEDIHVLVVDDSATIRHALRDLLQLHGYTVTTAGTFNEAVQAAAENKPDICLLDFYLQDSTGDELCAKLLENDLNGELMCAILTGTYSDHIIKQSLQAGATECMFKNEASELLLARIDALSRLVRQRRSMELQRENMGAVIDAIAGSVVIFDETGSITFTNDNARKVLGFEGEAGMLGLKVGEAIDENLPQAEFGKRLRGRFAVRSGEPVEVLYKCSEIRRSCTDRTGNGRTGNGRTGNDRTGPDSTDNVTETVVVFRTEEEVKSNVSVHKDSLGDPEQLAGHAAQGRSNSEKIAISGQSNLPQMLFLSAVAERLVPADLGMSTVLLMDVGYVAADHELTSVAHSSDAVEKLTESLKLVYRIDNHVAFLGGEQIGGEQFGGGKFGVLLEHKTEQQAYLLVRRIMQLTNDIGTDTGYGEFSVNGAVLRLDKNSSLTVDEVITRLVRGLSLIESRGRNNALLLDLKRLLPVYPPA